MFVVLLIISILQGTLTREIGFWIIADPHIDLYYQPGSDPFNQNFGDVGCRVRSSSQTHNAGKYGTPFANCDIPMVTFEEVLDFISTYPSSNNNSDLLLFLGDVPGHDIKNQTKEDNLNVIRLTYQLLKRKIKTVLPTLGNHDTYPIEQICASDYPLFKECGKFLLDLYADLSSSWIGSTEGMKKHGYYSYLLPETNLKFISLQTQWESIDNLFNHFRKTHFMVDWLRQELQNSRERDQKVILFGHIPVDADEPSPFKKLFPSWQSEFFDLVEEYYEIIVSSFFGHDHTDRFFLQRDSNGEKSVHVSFVCPSVVTGTPNLRHGGKEYETNNPSARLVKYDTEMGRLVDVITFVNDIEQSNIDGSMKKNWRKEYSFLEDYEMRDLSMGEFDRLVERFKNEDELFEKYWIFHHSSISNSTFDEEGKRKSICLIENSRMEKFDLCLTSQENN